MMTDWVQAVSQKNKKLLSSSIEESVESHLMAFAAEKSRLNRTIEEVYLFNPEQAAQILHKTEKQN